MQDEEHPKSPEEEEAERIAQARDELLAKATAAKLPDVPDWNYKRPEKPKPNEKEFRMSSKTFGLGMGVLYSLVVPAVGGLLIGMLADKEAGTGQRWMTNCFFIGIIAGFGMLIRLVMKMNEDEK